MTLVLTGDDLSIDDVVAVARDGRRVELAPAAMERIRAGHGLVLRMLEEDRPVYGLTTGVGALRDIRQDAAAAERYAHLSIEAHRTSHGPVLPEDVVRAAMVHRANTLARGRAMVRTEVAQAYVDALNDGDTPTVHAIGSVGQSDLPAMAEIAHHLVRRGLRLRQGEALPMLNANCLSVGHSALAVHDAARLIETYEAVGALSLEGFHANSSVLHADIADARPYAGLRRSLARLRELLAGSYLWRPEPTRQLQDPLSFLCLPQIMGAARDVLGYAAGQLTTELNASGDNPMLAPGDVTIVSVGNFDITPVAAALDLLRLSLAQVLTPSNERVQKHITERFSGLPTGLRPHAGPEDGLTLIGGGAAALAAEARLLALPVSLELPTSTIAGGIEDRLTMAPLGARRLADMVELGVRLAAVELVVAAQAVDLRGHPPLGEGTAPIYRGVRERVAFVGPEEAPDYDLDALAGWVAAGAR